MPLLTFCLRRVLLLAGFLVGVTGASSSLPARGEQIAATETSGRSLASDLRLATVGYRLSAASAAQCRAPDILTGLLLHEIGAYLPSDRAQISGLHGMTEGFGIRAVVAGSAAARAGFRSGDEILMLEGRDLRAFRRDLITQAASYDRTEAFNALLTETLALGQARMALRRDGMLVSISMQGQPGCGGRAIIVPGKARGAWTDGTYIALTPNMVNFAQNEDELAFIVAHEMAHNIMDGADLRNPPALMESLGIVSAPSRRNELNADVLAIGLMARAGYDPAAAEGLLQRLQKARGPELSLTHPGIKRRVAAIRAAIARVRATSGL